MQHADILISGGLILTLDRENKQWTDGALAVEGDTIVAVGPREKLQSSFHAEGP